MEWEEFDAPGVGTRMLFPMAWSLLPLTVGLILLVRRWIMANIIFGSRNYAVTCCSMVRSK